MLDLQGNINWMASREDELTADVWAGREHDLKPFCLSSNSDSANLDGVAELLTRSGEPIDKACPFWVNSLRCWLVCFVHVASFCCTAELLTRPGEPLTRHAACCCC